MGKSEKVQIGVVGPCAAGKTTLINGLKTRGYQARHIAQEHSYVKDMWQRITNPGLLIFLDVSFEVSMQRKWMNWTESDYLEQLRRLEHARSHAGLIIDTNQLTPEQVLAQVLCFLEDQVPGSS